MFSAVTPGEWCAECSRYVPVDELAMGNCPTCGTHLRDEKVPWHFKLLVLALCLYLGFRLVQAVIWVAHRLS